MERDRVPGRGRKRDLSVPMWKANLHALVTGLTPAAVLAATYFLLWGGGADGTSGPGTVYATGFVMVVLGVVAHEAIHCLSWTYFGGKPLSAVKFGFQLKTLTPYAHLEEPVTARAYRIGTALPGLLLGVLPALAGIATGSGWATFFGLFFTFAAGGDALVLWLIRGVDGGALVEDHPTNAGCYVYEAAG